MSIKTVENMIDWVELNLINNPTLDKMSEHVGYSSYYCSAKFHEVVGISFKEYVIRRKLALAATDLKETDSRIIDIAIKYGFSSNEAFSRAFYKYYGYSPRQFRQMLPKCIEYDKSDVLVATS
ncbi:MAG TPA: AraC family transcriptional regulator [Mobilitalea sp.]|nr:AraC family transcriptional regulator [Mobilitalea sp.]